MATVPIKIKPFMVPNFATFERVDNNPEVDVGMPLRDLPVETLVELADEWRAELFRKAGKLDPAKSGENIDG